jgi:hypothetical protein
MVEEYLAKTTFLSLYCTVNRLLPHPHPLQANIGKASTCHTARRHTKTEERKLSVLAVVAEWRVMALKPCQTKAKKF